MWLETCTSAFKDISFRVSENVNFTLGQKELNLRC